MDTYIATQWLIVIISAILTGYIIAYVLNIGTRMAANYLWNREQRQRKEFEKVAAQVATRINDDIEYERQRYFVGLKRIEKQMAKQMVITEAELYVSDMFEKNKRG